MNTSRTVLAVVAAVALTVVAVQAFTYASPQPYAWGQGYGNMNGMNGSGCQMNGQGMMGGQGMMNGNGGMMNQQQQCPYHNGSQMMNGQGQQQCQQSANNQECPMYQNCQT